MVNQSGSNDVRRSRRRYPLHERFLDEEAIKKFLADAGDRDEFKDAAWIEPGVGWGRVAIQVIDGLSKRKDKFGAKSAYYGFDKNEKYVEKLVEDLRSSSVQHDFCVWDITSEAPSAISACSWSLEAHTNVVVVLASFLSHVPNGLHLLRDKVLRPLLRAGKTVSVIVFQCEQNLLTSLIEGAILHAEVRKFVTEEATDYYSPLLDRWLDFSRIDPRVAPPRHATTAKTFFQLVDYLYCFKECSNLRRYSMVSPSKVTATDLTPLAQFLKYVGFERRDDLSIIRRAWKPLVGGDPLGWKWVRKVFHDWVYAGIMNEGLDAPLRDPIGQLLAFAMTTIQGNVPGAKKLPKELQDLSKLVRMYKSRLGTSRGDGTSIEPTPRQATALAASVRGWFSRRDSRPINVRNVPKELWPQFLKWVEKNRGHAVIATMKNRHTISQELIAAREAVTVTNRQLASDAIAALFGKLELPESEELQDVSTLYTDLWCFRFVNTADDMKQLDFRDALAFPLYSLRPEKVREVLHAHSAEPIELRRLLGSFPEVSTFRFPPELLEPVHGNNVDLDSPILQTIANWLARGGLGEWLVLGFFSSRQFQAKRESGEWNIASGTLFPFSSITAHNSRLLSLAAESWPQFSSIFFDDKLCGKPEEMPSRIQISREAGVTSPRASIKADLLGEFLCLQIPNSWGRQRHFGSVRYDTSLKNHWVEFFGDMDDKCKKIFARLDGMTGPIFIGALYRLREYEDCWRHSWTHCYYFLERRVELEPEESGEAKFGSKFFSGLAIYSRRSLRSDELAWCQKLSTLLVSEVSAPLRAMQQLDRPTQEAKNFRSRVDVVLPNVIELNRVVEEARRLSSAIERQIQRSESAIKWLSLGKTDAALAFDQQNAPTAYWGETEVGLVKSPDPAHGNKLAVIHNHPEVTSACKVWRQYSEYFRALGKHHRVSFLADLPGVSANEDSTLHLNQDWCLHAWMLLKILFYRSWIDSDSLYDAQILVTIRLALPSSVTVEWIGVGSDEHEFRARQVASEDAAGTTQTSLDFAQFVRDAVDVNRTSCSAPACESKIVCPVLSESVRGTIKLAQDDVFTVLSALDVVCKRLSETTKESTHEVTWVEKAHVHIETDSCTLRLWLIRPPPQRVIFEVAEANVGTAHDLRGAWARLRQSVGNNGRADFCQEDRERILLQWKRHATT